MISIQFKYNIYYYYNREIYKQFNQRNSSYRNFSLFLITRRFLLSLNKGSCYLRRLLFSPQL